MAIPVRNLGVDDWAWRKGQDYGTILVNLDLRRVVDLLPDRSSGSFSEWLKNHPEVITIARDRCGLYAEGATLGAPAAAQVADRFHLILNLSSTVERVLEERSSRLGPAASLGGGAYRAGGRRSAETTGEHSGTTNAPTTTPPTPAGALSTGRRSVRARDVPKRPSARS